MIESGEIRDAKDGGGAAALVKPQEFKGLRVSKIAALLRMFLAEACSGDRSGVADPLGLVSWRRGILSGT